MSVWMCASAYPVGGNRCGPPSVQKCGSLHPHHACDQMPLSAPILAIKCRFSGTASAQVIADQRSEGSTEKSVWRKRARVGAAISSHHPIIEVGRHTVKVNVPPLSSGPVFALQAISGEIGGFGPSIFKCHLCSDLAYQRDAILPISKVSVPASSLVRVMQTAQEVESSRDLWMTIIHTCTPGM